MRDEHELLGGRRPVHVPPPPQFLDGAPGEVDSDGSISWEDFIGTTTDLVPQLLGMFDELARGKCDLDPTADHHNHQQHCQVHCQLHQQQHVLPVQLQKRLSLAQKRKSRVSQLLCENNVITTTTATTMAPAPGDEDVCHEGERVGTPTILVEDKSSPRLGRELGGGQGSPTPLRYSGRRCRVHGGSASGGGSRPVSGSSIASSTSSSGCSHHGAPHHHHHHHHHHGSANPYLASVESLADTCASSQGSGDSGVVTISESSNGSNASNNNISGPIPIGSTANGKIRLEDVDRATALRHLDERRPRYCDPHRNPVERVLLEIQDTEDVYVGHLRQIIQGYLIFWRDDPASPIREADLNGLFSNIEDIYEFNRNFLSSLEKCGLDPIAVANTFVEHNTGFKVYTEYCTNYPRTFSIITDLMNQMDIDRAFRKRQVELGHALPLGAYLLKPVQRILKYHLLLEHLSKEFEADESDAVNDNDEEDDNNDNDGEDSSTTQKSEGRAAIAGALEAMTGIAQHINEMKRKHEHAVRVQEIQSLLYGWPGPDLTTCGELIAEGSFRMRGAKAPRHVFLFDRMLLLTKKREDGLLVYKAHILCSNLTLMESIPGEPLSFHVIPFDNSQIQYKLQARNLEQKREWTLQIKRVILENYSAVIPSHARQLVLQIGQNKYEDDALPERGYKKSSEYFDSRKSDRERRRSEIGLRQKLRKGRKSDVSISTADNSPMVSRKNQSAESISHFGSRDDNLNRSSEIRGSKIKDRFTSWRRKSEPGFQSYINLNPSDNEDDAADTTADSTTPTQDVTSKDIEAQTEANEARSASTASSKTKENGTEESKSKELKTQQSVGEIVGDILMQNQEFQRRMDKQYQRNTSCLHNNILKNSHRYSNDTVVDSSEDDDTDNEEKASNNCSPGSSSNNLSNKSPRSRFSRRDQCFVRAVNAYNQRSFRSQYDSFRNVDTDNAETKILQRQNSVPIGKSMPREKRSPPDGYKKPSIITESKLIRTALRIREHRDSTSEHEEPIYETPNIGKKEDVVVDDKGNCGNYDNLQHMWDGCCLEGDEECPSKAAVWLTKLCEGLPDQPQKCGSLPRSFQMMNPADLNHVSKSRFLQRDGKSMTERPFTIASDKPAEINLEDMERYASDCQGSTRIAKFPITGGGSSTSSSTFFCSLDDASFTDTDSMSRPTTLSTSTHVHPDHKIYRANGSVSKDLSGIVGSLSGSSLRNVFSKAGSRLQGLRSSHSTETLECSEEVDRTRYFRSFSKRGKKSSSKSSSRDAASDAEETVNCVVSGTNGTQLRIELPYHKQGSPSLGARIAQADYADPSVLFADSRRNLSSCTECNSSKNGENVEEGENEEEDEVFETTEVAVEGDSFYERSFETIENYVEGHAEEAFRDSAIFSDVDDSSLKSADASSKKIPPPVPVKRKIRRSVVVANDKPAIVQKPAHLKQRTRIVKCREAKIAPAKSGVGKESGKAGGKEDDVSAGQSQVGWVKKMVGQLQAQVDV